MNNWTAFHIFYHRFEKHDELIQLLTKEAYYWEEKKNLQKWFYLRYWEGGPHIRFRILNASQEARNHFYHQMTEFIAKNKPTEEVLTKEEYYKNHKFDGTPITNTDLLWYQDGEVKIFDYIPEYERYGGHEVMPFSETIFMHSSKITSYILKNYLKFEHKLIYGAALYFCIFQEVCKKFHLTPVEDFLETNIDFWKVYKSDSEDKIIKFFLNNEDNLNKIILTLEKEPTITPIITSILQEFQQIHKSIDSLEIKHSILGSHLHMTANRLGISPPFERGILIWILQRVTLMEKNVNPSNQ